MGRYVKFLLVVFTLFVFTQAFSQQKTGQMIVQKAKYFDISKPLKDMKPVEGWQYLQKKEEHEVPNHFLFKLFKKTDNSPDPLSQRFLKASTSGTISISQVFSGLKNSDNVDGLVAPPDTQGDVSPNFYMQAVNNMTAIYDRTGKLVWGPQKTSVFWDGFQGPWTGTNDGDPVILYDENAQRWIVSQFAISTSDNSQWELIAVSVTSDPTGQYYRYAFQFDDMPDYPKLGVWPDAYYLSANAFGARNGRYKGTYVAALERDKMLAGDPNARMIYQLNSDNSFSFLPSDADVFPPLGTPNYFVYDEDDNTYWSADALEVYGFYVDWSNTSNSRFVELARLTPATFNSSFSSGAPQAGTSQDLDLLNDRMMFRAYFRPFSDHKSLVLSRTVNDGGVAAIRWYELRDDGNGWYIYQQGTFNPGDGLWRWMPSIAMNANGDIALGYSVSGDNMYPSIRVTGRHAGDPLGVMTLPETSVFEGSAAQTGVSRWGDYAMMSVDPNDNTTFWFTTEYSTGGWYWATKVAKFDLGAGGTTCDLPVITQQPQSADVCQGSSVTFSVTATGATGYQWRKDGVDIPGATQSSYTISSVTSSDVGNYDCVVSNDCGSVTSNQASLTIGSGITITQQPQSKTVKYGSTVNFTVVAEGNNLTYQWYHDGSAMTDGGDISGSQTSTLTIGSAGNSDKGDYWCEITGDCGSTTSDVATLTIRGGKPIAGATDLITSVNIYPNPFVNEITITLPKDKLPAVIDVIDASGRVIKRYSANSELNKIDMSFARGTLFMLLIKTQDGQMTYKVTR